MPVVKSDPATTVKVKAGLQRRIAYTSNLMMAVIDFTEGPWSEPEPLQNHVHEQVTYIAEGELLFFCEGEETQRLTSGDIFMVPSNRKHGIQLLSRSAKLVDTFNPIRTEFL